MDVPRFEVNRAGSLINAADNEEKRSRMPKLCDAFYFSREEKRTVAADVGGATQYYQQALATKQTHLSALSWIPVRVEAVSCSEIDGPNTFAALELRKKPGFLRIRLLVFLGDWF